MASKSCATCYGLYNSSDHRPLLLDCCHTTCYLCVSIRKTSDGIRCFRCQKLTVKPVDQLPTNLDLMPTSVFEKPPLNLFLTDLCKSHKIRLEYLCADCEALICKQCHKDSHIGHSVDLIKNIAGAGSVAGPWNKVHSKLLAKVDLLTKTLEVPREMLHLVAELKRDFTEWQNLLEKNLESARKDLSTWNALATTSSREITVKEVVQRLKKDELPQCKKLPQIKASIETLRNKSIEIEGQLLPDLEEWAVASEAASEAALASLTAGRRPKKVVIHSWPSGPLHRLPQLLDAVAKTCTGGIELFLMNSFWSIKVKKDEHLSETLQKHREKIESFCGTTDDALAVCLARGQSSARIGARLAMVRDVTSFAVMQVKPYYVSCIRGLSSNAGVHMKKHKWAPAVWSFPSLNDGNLEWMFTILKPFASDAHPHPRSLFLPSCHLTQENIHKLILHCGGSFSYFECEARAINEEAQSVLLSFSKRQGISFKWMTY